MKFIRSNLLGLIAIFIALGGTAYAIQKAPKNSVVSSSIKKGQVKTSDLADGAVTGPKLGASSVDSSKVADNSLNGSDIDESSLALPLSLAGDTPQPTDHEVRIVISASELSPASNENPPIGSSFGAPAAYFDPTTDDSVSAVTEVPLDRAPGTGLEARILWDSNGTGDVTWRMGFAVTDPGEAIGVPEGTDTPTPSKPGAIFATTLLQIPPGAVSNGDPIGLLLSRNANAASDTTPTTAQLRMIEIRYTATG